MYNTIAIYCNILRGGGYGGSFKTIAICDRLRLLTFERLLIAGIAYCPDLSLNTCSSSRQYSSIIRCDRVVRNYDLIVFRLTILSDLLILLFFCSFLFCCSFFNGSPFFKQQSVINRLREKNRESDCRSTVI